MDIVPRVVTLVLVDAHGAVLGALPPFVADTPWWQDMAPVVRSVRARHGLRVSVLRLIDHELPAAPGGAVSYLAQHEGGDLPASLQPWHGELKDHPLRLAYARPGGPAADLAWARARLSGLGVVLDGEPQQDRTWNLSCLWFLPTTHGGAWLKVVPPFFAHEGRLLAALAGERVPHLLGHDGPRVLMAPLPGVDGYDTGVATCLQMIDLLVDLQVRWAPRGDELLALGVPDQRAASLASALAGLVARRAGELDTPSQARLGRFADTLPQRLAALAGCGLPDTLVHGDFHPGNLRVDGAAPVALLDWGDSVVGHPLLDLPAFIERMPADSAEFARRHWAAAWQRALPAAEVDAALALLAPVAAARKALVYQRFLDQIEDDEQTYHRADVLPWLQRCAMLVGT